MITRKVLALFTLVLILTSNQAFAQASGLDEDELALVQTSKESDGWHMTVDGIDFYIKGVVWAFTPPGENYAYNLWQQPDSFIERLLDTDMTLLKQAGVNTIRCFSIIPPRWVEYIHDRYGIYSIVNDTMGRYGVSVDGVWQARTDYSNPRVRATLVATAKKTAETFKNTRGVLMYLLGNESNYGLEWESTAIENLPVGERLEAKASYLYSLFGEAVAAIKEIDTKRPVGIVNGDIQYLGLIKEHVSNLDILGVNVYRGRKAYNMFYESIAQTLDKPVFFTEMGADAFNVVSGKEDQYHQAEFLKSQWEEIYQQSAGKGKSGNMLGATVFEWVDEWWKHGMEKGLLDHDTLGTWNNGGYDFDARNGINNMNEEWFGLAGQSLETENGVHKRLPRAAYYLLQQVWKLEGYDSNASEVSKHFNSIQIAEMVSLGESQSLRNDIANLGKTTVSASLSARTYAQWFKEDMANFETLKTRAMQNNTQTARIAIESDPAEGLHTGVDFRVFGTPFYDGANRSSFMPEPTDLMRKKTETASFELYAAHAEYSSDLADGAFYYHTGHPDWQLEGDFFGLLPETFDTYHQDEVASKAPFGFEIKAKGIFDGLTVYAGPELWFGGFPAAMVKYWKDFGTLAVGIVHQEEMGYPEDFSLKSGTVFTQEQIEEFRPLARASSLYGEADFLPLIKAQLGVLVSGSEQVGRLYKIAKPLSAGSGWAGSDTGIFENRVIGFMDTLAGRLRLSTNAIPFTQYYIQGIYAGAVADSKASVPRAGSQLADIGTGNRIELETGALLSYGDFTLAPKFLWRNPVYDAVPDIAAGAGDPAMTPRNWLDPFYVFDNRQALQAEIVAGYDPTGGTWLYDWNSDDRENGAIAAYVSLLYNIHLGPTDAREFTASSGDIWYWQKDISTFPDGTAQHGGLSAVDGTWSLAARVITNPGYGLRALAKIDAGRGQSVSIPDDRIVEYLGGSFQLAYDRILIEGASRLNSWGPFQYNREFNQTWPLQWNLGVAWGFQPLSFMDQSNRLGLMLYSETLDKYSDLSAPAAIGTRYELQAYLNFSL